MDYQFDKRILHDFFVQKQDFDKEKSLFKNKVTQQGNKQNFEVVIIIIRQKMNGPFSSSRLANLREKRPSHNENPFPQKQQQKPLALQLQQEPTYQPSMNVLAGRTATRFLKGRIERTSGSQKPNVQETATQGIINKENNNNERKPTLRFSDAEEDDLKLVLNDSPQFDKKKSQIKVAPQQPVQKRILIQKKQQEVKPQIKPQIKQEVIPPVNNRAPTNKVQEQPIAVKNNPQQKIVQQPVQQSTDGLENQNELIDCPEGCGRKFNRKALQKHAKACKLVFMSKRKQFNSEAKRLTSQEQAALIKQNKLQQKKAQIGMTKGKGFQKTGQNWKAASQDFRSAVKAIKKEGGDQTAEKQEMKMLACEYCEKQFAEVLLAKHLQNCVKKKEKQQKKKATKKK